MLIEILYTDSIILFLGQTDQSGLNVDKEDWMSIFENQRSDSGCQSSSKRHYDWTQIEFITIMKPIEQVSLLFVTLDIRNEEN